MAETTRAGLTPAGSVIMAALLRQDRPRARGATPAQCGALIALSRAGAYLAYTIHGAVVIDMRGRRTNVSTLTARALAARKWTCTTPRRILSGRETWCIAPAGRFALAAAKKRARRARGDR